MKKRTSSMSRRIVSLLMSMVLTLTLVTPAAFATEVVDGSGTTIVEGNTNPADAAPGEDSENNEDKNTEDGKDEQLTEPGDEDKNPGEGEGDDANKPDEDKKDEAPDGENKDEENKDEQPAEDENDGEDEIDLLDAENGTDVWDGTAVDTSWYAGHENETKFSIGTAAELAGLAALVNGTAKDAEGKPIAAVNFYDETTKTGKTIKLTADIDLGNQAWTPIGNGDSFSAFSGTFNGDGYTVSGLNVPDTYFPGLFGQISKIAAVQNLIVKGSVTVGDKADTYGYGEGGGVVCENGGTVQNCGFYGSVNKETDYDYLDAGGVAGGGYGKVLNCWYYMTDESSSVSAVSVCTATNCVVISSSDAMKAAKLATLQTNAPETGKAWSWTEGALYPKLIDPPKAITMQPVFPDCKAEVSANGTALTAANGYTYEVEEVAVITVSGNSGTLYYAASEGDKAYTTEGENANLKKLESDTTFNKNTLPKTYYYGTLADFAALAAWNSVTYDVITAHNQLKALARMVNSGKDSMTGRNFMLSASIDLSGIDWTPIGTAENPFKGTFTIMGNYSISNLPNDLFGVVEGGTVKSVTISGGTGRLVNTLKSGTVENCMSTAKVTGEGGGLVGTSAGTVKNSYYYNEGSKNTVAVSGNGTVASCYYLADVSTWGQESDTGARTEEEFKAGRVTWELGSSWGANASDNLPCLGSYKKLYQLTLTKLGDAGVDGVTIENDNALTNGDTQYLYGTAETEVRLKETISDGSTITYSPAKPEKIQDPKNNSTVNTYYYTIGEKVDADISWYKDADNEFTLTNAAELFGLAQLVNGGTNFANKTVKLGEDIDLIGYIWTPIGSGKRFSGTFDGGNHTITGMRVYAAGISYSGLFGYVYGGTMQNLRVEGSVTTDGVSSVGGIVGQLGGSGTVTNCLSKVNIEGSGKTANVGGIVGKVESGAVNLCWNEGTVTGGSGSTGGIVGTNSGGTVTNCANFGEVTGSSTASGIVGIGTAANSYNLGDVTGAEGRAYGISSQPATNSYYICKLNDAETAEMKYVDRETTKQDITTAEENGKTVYAVDNDVLVNVLNKNKSTYIEWINKQDAPNNPVHITRWDGSFEEGVEGVITLIYEPNNGGVQTAVTEQQRVEGDTGSFTIKSDTELGFKHENGTFLGWSTDPRAKTADNRYTAGKTVSVEKDKTVTLYAVWENIWTGSGTEADAYQISNAADLTALQTQVNEKGFSYTGKWFILTSDINLNNANWTPIGIDAFHPFSGNLDGGNHAISGLKVNTSTQWAGLFGYVDSPAGNAVVMRDLTLKDGSVTTTFTGTSFCGGLVAYAWGGIILNDVTVEGFTVKGGIDGTGGLMGSGSVAMTNCHNRGGSVTGRYAGGLAGKGYSNLQDRVFAGCTNKAAVVGERTAGGMTGNETYSNGSYTSCTNSGSISATQGYASGIAAGGSYERCSNSGAVTGQHAAGICVNGSKATNCSNTGAVTGTGTGYAAGILTNGGYGGTVEFCWNTGSVEASTPVEAFGILCGWGAYNRVRNSFSYVPGANIGLAPTELKEKNVSDSYYLADKKDSVSSVGEWASADDFASGKVAWGVDGGTGDHAGWWTQDTAKGYPKLLPAVDKAQSYYRAQATCGTGGTVTLDSSLGYTSTTDADNAVYGPKDTSVTIKATPKDNTMGLKSLTWTHNGQTDTLPTKGTPSIVIPAESNVTIHAEFASVGPGGNGGYYYGGSGDGTGTGDKDDEGLQDGLNMDVEYDIKGLVLDAYAEWGSNGGNKSFQKWLEENPNVVRALLTNSLDNMATAAVGKKTDEAKDLAALLLASLNEHTGVDGKDGDTIAKALQKYIDSGSEEVFSAWLTGGGGMASGTYESIYGQYASSLAALADRLYSKWEASGTSMTFPVWLDSQQVSMDSLSENADEPDTDNANDPQTSDAPDDVPDGQDTEGGASGNSVWEIIGTVVRENPIIVWSIVAVIVALIIVGAVRRYHKVKRDEHDEK